MATIILDYDKRNTQAQKVLDDMLALGFFKIKTTKRPYRENIVSEEKDYDFLYSVSEHTLAKDWLNEYEAWKNM